jgi:hypothetical protein
MEDEVVSTPSDKNIGGLPRHESARRAPRAPRRSSLWTTVETQVLAPAPLFGAFPRGFLPWACRQLRAAPSDVLHVCSGMLSSAEGGVRVDVRRAAAPTLQADGRALPFRDGVFRAVLIDPPWSKEYARDLYQTEYPRPSHLLREAVRVARPGARIGFVHFLVPAPPAGALFVAVKGITTGCGYRIRAFTIYERKQEELAL